MDTDYFPEIPESLTDLTDEQLEELHSEVKAAFLRAATGEAFEGVEDAPDRNARRDILAAGKDALLALKSEQEARAEEAEAYATEVAAIVNEAGVTLEAEKDEPAEDDDPADKDKDDEPELEPAATAEVETEAVEVSVDVEVTETEVPELVTAAATPARVFSRPPPTPKRNQPLTVGDGGPVLVATAGSGEIGEGTPLDRESLARLTAERLSRFVGSSPAGFREKVVIAKASWAGQYPEGRQLHGDNMYADMEKIRSVRGPEALVAAGGFCAPSTVRYDVGAIGTQSRPVRDALTPFLATRGGINFVHDLSISNTDVSGAISNITEAEDIAGGTAGTKDCLVIDCPDFLDVRADIIATCLQAGNLMQSAFPELIAAWQDLVGVAAARNRDSALLDAISTDPLTKNVTYAKQYGALYSVVAAYAKAAAGYRSRHRMDNEAVLRALAPAWLADLLVLDSVGRANVYPEGLNRNGVAALIQQLTSVSVTWYLDSATGDAQVFDAQSDSTTLDAFPTTAVSFLYPEGGILFVDQGELNLGLVRDSVLNATNDAQFFAEVFETAAVVGPEVIEITSTICPTGETGPAATAITC